MDTPADRRARGLKPLDEANPGEKLTIVSVFERDRKLLEYLDSVGIRPGVVVQVTGAGESIELHGRVRVDRAVAARVWTR
jgi:DtxR family Mn-dependent transcriptional regulator